MDVATASQYVAVLEKAGLLTPQQLEQARKAAAQAENAEALARTLVRGGLLNRWQAGQVLTGRTNFMLGKYRLIDLLGRGGMGNVFLAQHVTMNRRVALKLVPKGIERDRAAMQRFLAEARAIATVDHPNIVQAYSVDSEDDRYYLVMEYVEGRDLQRAVDDDGPMPYSRAADYIRQAAEGLAHAHGRRMIHCDIKPSNLLVNQQGVVKILDLGLARLHSKDDVGAAKADEQVVGTVDYMAPEQALGSETFDHRADIYSLGCTFYFLLTGHPPFPEGTLAQRIVKHQSQQPKSILEQRPDAPRALLKICRKMMAKDPADRYQSAADVSCALGEWNPAARDLKRAVPLEEIGAAQTPAPKGTDSGVVRALGRSGTAGARPAPAAAKGLAAKVAWIRNPGRLVVLGAMGAVALLLVTVVVVLAVHGVPSRRTKDSGKAPDAAPAATPAAKKPVSETPWGGLKLQDDATPSPPSTTPPQKPAEKPAAQPTDNSAAQAADQPSVQPAAKPGAKPGAKSGSRTSAAKTQDKSNRKRAKVDKSKEKMRPPDNQATPQDQPGQSEARRG